MIFELILKNELIKSVVNSSMNYILKFIHMIWLLLVPNKFANLEILSPYASRTDTRFRIIKYLENNVNLPV